MDTVANMIEVVMIHDPALGSPPEALPLANKNVCVSQSLIPLPQRGVFLGQPGFSRQTPFGDPSVMRWEWVLQGDVNILDTFVDSLTGRGSWVVPTSRTTVKTIVQALLNKGFSRTQVNNQFPALYQAVAAEIRAEDALTP